MRSWLLILLLVPTVLTAQTHPKIGLVLSGGGAKGAAHIGVLKVLEENNIPIDFIVGTSIGAYVGGLYALGYNADDVEAIMFNTNFDKGYSDFIPREQLRYDDKQRRDDYNITLRLGYSDNTLKMPSGLLLGQSTLQVLKTSIGAVGVLDSFDSLPIPYRAVATDIATSKAVILDAGSLSQAVKASSTVPGALEPINIEGKLLVDGGIVNNMPIDVAKSLGADIIIAVDIGSPLLDQKEINSTVDVLNQLSNILTINTTDKQKLLLTEEDILIRPDIDKISTTDFSQLEKALLLGQNAAENSLAELQKLSLSDAEYQRYLQQKASKRIQWSKQLNKPVIAIEYLNDSKVDISLISEHFDIHVGDIVNSAQLEDAIQAVYALDRFDFVNAEFIDSEAGRTIQLTTKEKSWGPNYLLFGFSWQGDFSSDSAFSLDLSYLLTDITDNGGSLKNEISVGWENLVATELYQPFDRNHNSFARIRLQYQEQIFADNKFTDINFRPELKDQNLSATAGLGYHYTDNGLAEMGTIVQRGELSFEDGNNSKLKYHSIGAYVAFGYDNLNSINFPTQGNKIELQIIARKDNYEEAVNGIDEDENIEISLDWRGAVGLGNHTFVGITSISTLITDSDFSIHLTELGGFLNLSGFQKDALIGVNKFFVAAVYQYDLGRDVPGGTGLPLYLGGSIENGNVWAADDSIAAEDLITASSLYLGTDTSFGPAVIGIGYATSFGYYYQDQFSVFFSIGKNW